MSAAPRFTLSDQPRSSKKGHVVMQRFISNFIPINEFLEALPDFLPYVGQLGLILLEEGHLSL